MAQAGQGFAGRSVQFCTHFECKLFIQIQFVFQIEIKSMDSSEWKHVFANIHRQGLLMDENVLTDNFQDVVNKAFDPDMGFGYVSENGYKTSARVILQGKNPFLDNHTVSPDYKG